MGNYPTKFLSIALFFKNKLLKIFFTPHILLNCFPRGYSDIFIHTFKILNFKKKIGVFINIKKKWGYEDFVDIFGGHHKIGLYLGIISMHFRVDS